MSRYRLYKKFSFNMEVKKGEFKVRVLVLIAGVLLFSLGMIIFSGQGFQNYGSQISEQISCLFGSIISELGKW